MIVTLFEDSLLVGHGGGAGRVIELEAMDLGMGAFGALKSTGNLSKFGSGWEKPQVYL